MLTLRSAMGLTQVGLAELLGVSRYALGDWESGEKYPKAEHLKHFITLAVQHRVFSASHETEEIHALWQLAHQRALLNEHWVTALLASNRVEPTTSHQMTESRSGPFDPSTYPSEKISSVAEVPFPSLAKPLFDWGNALKVSSFYGRENELNLLTSWVVEERCQVVSVVGFGGIGKSALVVQMMHQLANHFQVVIWRSLRDLPTCAALLDEILQVLAPETFHDMGTNFDRRMSILLDHMRNSRILLVLDNLESVLEEGDQSGRSQSGYEDYERLLFRVGETTHQSCLLFTSRQKPTHIALL